MILLGIIIQLIVFTLLAMVIANQRDGSFGVFPMR